MFCFIMGKFDTVSPNQLSVISNHGQSKSGNTITRGDEFDDAVKDGEDPTHNHKDNA